MEAKKTAARRSDQDAIAMLKADHERVRQLCAQYERAAGAKTPDEARKRGLAERLCQEIDVHAQLEEELFYPAARAVLKVGDLLDEAQVEHQSAKDLVRQIRAMTPGDALYDAKVKVLGEYVAHHVQEEETQMFPKARRAKLDLVDLARRMTERRQQLEAEHAMEPFDTIASMLMTPIRAAASAARAGAAAARGTGTKARAGAGTKARAGAGTKARATIGAKARAGTVASKRPATAAATRATRATGAATGAVGRTATRTAGAVSRAVGTAARSTARAAGTVARAAAGGRAGAGSGGGRASASAGTPRAAKGGRTATKAGIGARRGRTTG